MRSTIARTQPQGARTQPQGARTSPQVARTRQQVDEVTEALLSDHARAVPETLPGLQQAVESLEQLRRELSQLAPESGDAATNQSSPSNRADRLTADRLSEDDRVRLRGELEALQVELRRTSRLLAFGSDFWASWAGLLGLGTGYTAAGVPAEVARGSQVSLRG